MVRLPVLVLALCACSDAHRPDLTRFEPPTIYKDVGIEDAFIDATQVAADHLLVTAPAGTGTACSQEAPCSLLEAKEQAAARSEDATADIVILLSDGVYRLSEPLRLTAADSGKHGHKIIWSAAAAAHPVLSGAMRVTGWELSDEAQNFWRSQLPRPVATRQLYIDGARAPVAQGMPPVELSGDDTGYTATDSSYSTWRNPQDLEFVYVGGNGEWTETRCRVAAVSGDRITMSQPCWNNVINRPAHHPPAYDPANLAASTAPTRIENAIELMQEGQWYLDAHTSELFYRAQPGFDIEQADVELPLLEQLIVGDGSLDEPVHDVELRGLELAYATWMQPSTPVGFADVQANLSVTGGLDEPPQGTCNFSEPMGSCPFGAYTAQPAHVSFRNAQNIALIRNRFVHLGATGLAFTGGSRENRITGNVFRDISGGAIALGDPDTLQPTDPDANERLVPVDNAIDNNFITEIGAEYSGAVGILLFVTQRSVVRNNEIHDVPYTGISSGVTSGHANVPDAPDTITSFNADNSIVDNVIYRYLSVLNDGGAIYLEGHQNETVYDATGTIDQRQSFAHGLAVTGNVVFHQGGKGNALYNDIGSQWIVWRDNVQWQASSANGGCLPVGHIQFVDNYHSDRLNDFGCGKPVDFSYDGNTRISRRPTVDELPRALLMRAGLESTYWDVTAPRLEYASPSSGTAQAPTPVLIAGSGFAPETAVAWGELAASSVELLSSNFMVAQAPRGADFTALRVGSIRLRINDTDPRIEYVGEWAEQRQRGHYDDDTLHSTRANGALFRYRFDGRGIDFITSLDRNRGDVAVYVDETLHEVVSCSAPSLRTQQTCARVADLPPGSHMLEIVKKSGESLVLDALQVH